MCLRYLSRAALVCALILPATVYALDYPERTWTNDKGETIEARLLRASSTTAMLRQNGENIRAPIERLSPEDQAWLELTKELRKFREWTLASGAKRKARLSSYENDKLELKEDGQIVQLSLDDLSSSDQTLIANVFHGTGHALQPASNQGSTFNTTQAGNSAAGNDFTPNRLVTRDWTNISGKTIKAEFRGAEGDKIILFYKDREWRVPLWRFSAADKQFVADARTDWQSAQPVVASSNAGSNITATFSPPRIRQSEQPNRALEVMREQQARMQREAEERRREQQAQMERDRQERERREQERLAEQQQLEEQRQIDEQALADNDPSGYEDPTSDSYASLPEGMWVNEYICFQCDHTWESTEELGVNDRCPNCGVTFDYVEDENGDVVEGSSRKYRRIIRLVIFAVLAAGGAVAKMSRS